MKKILLVDDSIFYQKHITNLVKSKKIEIISAKDGIKGLQIFENDTIDLIITDISMPLMDGWEMISRIREIDNEVPIIALVVNLPKNRLIDPISKGVNEIIFTPPLDENHLVEITNSLLN